MMQAYDLYKDIADRTQGDVYIGVVGPVRTGKSTFIQKFMEKLVIQGIKNPHQRARVLDELPQSGSGRTVMTTKPAFVPNEAVEVELARDNPVRLRLIDSVGYLVEGALGAQDGDGLRMVKTPWSESEMSFEQAAEVGTRKVISEHSTIGLVVTTDGTVTELPRSAYVAAETRVVDELRNLGKPFVVILNTLNPESGKVQTLRKQMEEDYGVPVLALNVDKLEEEEIQEILAQILGQFELVCVHLQMAEWLAALDEDHWLLKSIAESIANITPEKMKIGDISSVYDGLKENEWIEFAEVRKIHHGCGAAMMYIVLKEGLFNRILAEQCGTEIRSDAHLLSLLTELVKAKKEYDHVAQAIESVKATGYGLVPPKMEELTLQEPEITKQGGKFGVKLRASAPSLHMIKVGIQTEVCPVVGTEQQSEEMIRYLMEGFDQNPQKLWQSNLFGKPLCELVREGLSNKLMHMPPDTQIKMQQTLEKIINEGNGTMVCILL